MSKILRVLDSVDAPENLGELKQDDSPDLTVFSFDSILLATNKFSTKSKLGQGGFGSVYKVKPFCRTFDKWKYRIIQGLNAIGIAKQGKLNGGMVAVKRLSSSSAQGIEEFKNVIVLISTRSRVIS